MKLHHFYGLKATLDNTLKDSLYNQVLNKWHATTAAEDGIHSLPDYQRFEQWANEVYIKRHLDDIFDAFSFDSNTLDIDTQAERIKPLLKAFILDAGFLSASEKAFMSRHDFIDASLDFIKRAQREDGLLSLENLGQALRNFWIANLLQAIFHKAAALTPGLYGYSMLYPYTDNLMDDDSVTMLSKHDFCHRLTETLDSFAKNQWLNDDLSLNEQRIHALCQLIYEDFDRPEQERVQFGLQWIHEAQMDSLKQQQACLLPYELDILKLTFHKGGSSLIADALIVEPDLSQEALVFCYHLGAVLQLCDDLQDTYSDAENHHQTLFSQLKDHYVFDNLLNHLFAFSCALKPSAEAAGIKSQELVDTVLIPNTNLLLLFSAVAHEQLFSRRWIDRHKQYLPITPNGLKRLQRRIKKNLKNTSLGKRPVAMATLSFKELSKVATF